MAQPMRTYPEAYPQQNPHYGYDQGPPAYNPAPSAPQTQVVVNQAAPATANNVYGHNQGPPAYHPAPPAPKTQVIVNQPAPATANTVFVTTQVRPPTYLVLSIFVLLCCNPVLGFIALVFSILSDSDYGAGHVEGARSKGKIAMGLNIAGMVTTIIVIVVILVAVNSVYGET